MILFWKKLNLLPFILINLVSVCSSQSLEETIKFAENRLLVNDLVASKTAFERASYFGHDSIKSYCYFALGKIYSLEDDYFQAINYFEKSILFPSSDSLKNICRIEISYLHQEQENYEYSLAVISEIDDSLFYPTKLLHQAIDYFWLGEYSKAEQLFIQLNPEKTFPKINSCIADLQNDFKKTRKAKVLSAILPGTGQFYCKDFKNGFNSFFLNAGLGTLLFLTIHTYGPVSGIITIFPWLFRYYYGGILKAEKICISYNKKLASKSFSELLNITQKNSNFHFY